MLIKKNFFYIRNTFYFLLFFLILSFYFSVNKIYIPFLIAVIFLLTKEKIKKILFLNLIIFSFLFKFLIIYFENNNTLSKLIYEKHFLYGVQKIDDLFLKQSGDLSGFLDLDEDTSGEKIKIKTDEYGFRNEHFDLGFDFIFVGDSFLHQHRLDQDDLINYQLKRSGIKVYNAGIAVYDISHYFEIIKFFKEKRDYNNKFIMFVYPGNDFLNYRDPKKNYHKFFDNPFLKSYIKMRKFLNFHFNIKFLTNLIQKEDNYKDKVSSYLINKKKMYFFNDFMNSSLNEITFSNSFSKIYKNLLPDLLIIIPTKFDIYCNFIDELKCKKNDYKKKINSNELFKNVPVVDSTPYLIKKAEIELLKDKFIYDLKDTHLNVLGNKYLSEFFIEIIKK